MKEIFIDKQFGFAAREMLRAINAILDSYAAQGYDLSLRQLYYQLVSRNIVPNTERSYKKVGVLVSDARLAGVIDWDMIADRGRVCVKNPHWDGPKDFLDIVAPQFRLNLWEGQPNYVEVMVEKQALEGVLVPVCRKYDVPFTANKGYSSSSALYEASKRYLAAAEARPVGDEGLHVIYLGDHDPSGIDMSRDIGDRLDMFVKTSQNRWDEIGPREIPAVRVHRVALNMAQIKSMRPPENPAKLTDSRATSYVRRFGNSSWELDAIEPAKLAKLLSKNIERLLNMDLFRERKAKQHEVRGQLIKFGGGYDE
jgi:hypothetical protein